ncbi:hypothetical protein DPV78_003675 [Talaromyces pinophilus]|nr:hypothetical protein DPV78_003675 [Talaromyces pinophilus]
MADFRSHLFKWALDPPPVPPMQAPDSAPFDLRSYLNKTSDKTESPIPRKSKASDKVAEAQRILHGQFRPTQNASRRQLRPAREASDSDSLFHDSDDVYTDPFAKDAATIIPDYEPHARGSLPPMNMYPMQMDYKEVADEINRWLAKHKQGYGIVIQRSNKTAMGNLRSVTLGCDRGGAYKNSHRVTEADRRRRYTRPTRKVSCPFRFQIKPGDEGAWKATMVSDVHNHFLSEDVAEHAKQRQLFLSPGIKDEIIAMFNAKVPARKVLAELEKNHGDIPIRRKDLYNLKRTASIKSQLHGSNFQSPGES